MLAAHPQDASDEFNAIHSSKAKAQLDDFLLGELTTDGIPPAGAGLLGFRVQDLKPSHAALERRPCEQPWDTNLCIPGSTLHRETADASCGRSSS